MNNLHSNKCSHLVSVFVDGHPFRVPAYSNYGSWAESQSGRCSVNIYNDLLDAQLFLPVPFGANKPVASPPATLFYFQIYNAYGLVIACACSELVLLQSVEYPTVV